MPGPGTHWRPARLCGPAPCAHRGKCYQAALHFELSLLGVAAAVLVRFLVQYLTSITLVQTSMVTAALDDESKRRGWRVRGC
jgi:hypothetical protein